jgi:hypothetical protein
LESGNPKPLHAPRRRLRPFHLSLHRSRVMLSHRSRKPSQVAAEAFSKTHCPLLPESLGEHSSSKAFRT